MRANRCLCASAHGRNARTAEASTRETMAFLSSRVGTQVIRIQLRQAISLTGSLSGMGSIQLLGTRSRLCPTGCGYRRFRMTPKGFVVCAVGHTMGSMEDATNDEYALDLFWHALNYRTAAPQHAEAMWVELEACVRRIVANAVDGRGFTLHWDAEAPEEVAKWLSTNRPRLSRGCSA